MNTPADEGLVLVQSYPSSLNLKLVTLLAKKDGHCQALGEKVGEDSGTRSKNVETGIGSWCFARGRCEGTGIERDKSEAFGKASANARHVAVQPVIALAEQHPVPCPLYHDIAKEFLWAEATMGMNSEDEFSVREIDNDFGVHVSTHEVHIQLGIADGSR